MNTPDLSNMSTPQPDYTSRVQSGQLEPGWALFRPSSTKVALNVLTNLVVFGLFAGFLALFLLYGNDEGGNNTVFVVFFGAFTLLFLFPLLSSLSYVISRSRHFVLLTNDTIVINRPKRTTTVQSSDIESITQTFRKHHAVWPQTVIEIKATGSNRTHEISSQYYPKIRDIHAAITGLVG